MNVLKANIPGTEFGNLPRTEFGCDGTEDGDGEMSAVREELHHGVGGEVEEDGHRLEPHALLLQQQDVVCRQSELIRQRLLLWVTARTEKDEWINKSFIRITWLTVLPCV